MKPGCVIWLTGLPSSGKTTIAERLASSLRERGRLVEVLDGDEVRLNLSKDLGFSKEDREKHAQRVGFVGKVLSRNGIVAIVALISPYRSFREGLRRNIDDFVEVYVKCPVEVCMERDVKGLYGKAMRGEIADFTGVQDPYEEPDAPELVLDTAAADVDACVNILENRLSELGYV